MEEVLEQGRGIFPIYGFSSLTDYVDDDLAAMYLTDRKGMMQRSTSDHEELEVLLETFAKQVEEIVNEAEGSQVHRS